MHVKSKNAITLVIFAVVFTLMGCSSSNEKADETTSEWLPQGKIIKAAILELEGAESLEYRQKKTTKTIFNNEEYYGSVIITSQEIFTPRCRYWIREEIFPDYDENINPGTKFEFYLRNDGSTFERAVNYNGTWEAQLPVTGELARVALELENAMWESYWFLLNSSIPSFTGPPLEGWINDTETISYYGYITAETVQEAYHKYYEDHHFWENLEDPYKMMSGVPAMTLIDKPVSVCIRFDKATVMPVRIELDITDIEKAVIEQSRQIAGDQGNQDEDFREIEIDEVNLIYEIEGIDSLRQIKPPMVHLIPKLN